MKSLLFLDTSTTKRGVRQVICALSLLLLFSTAARGQDHRYHRYATLQPAPQDRQVSDARQSMQLAAALRPKELPRELRTTVSLHLKEATLEEALRRIAAQAGLDLFFASQTVAGRKLTLNLQQVSAYEAVQEALQGAGLALMVLRGGQLLIADRPKKVEPRVPSAQLELMKLPVRLPATIEPAPLQTGTITGTVTDATTGETLPGVNVVIEGTQQGAATDANGTYTITGVEPGTYTLRASFIGYGDEVKEGVEVIDGETTVVDFAMQPSALGLDEVVVIGYGEQQRRDLTGAVSSISAEQLETMPNTSIAQALQGRSAGVRVIRNSHEPGGGFTVRIRGTGSIRGGNEPLYVIDGVPVYNLNGPSISPSMIESIQVLKDASATAIYGARGANGVVLITTKQGIPGQNNVNFESYIGMQYLRRKIPVLNAVQFARLTNDAHTNVGLEPVFSGGEIASFGEGTDWQNELYQPAPVQNYHLSVSGGDDQTRYAISGSYMNQEGIVIGSGFRRTALRINLDQDINDLLNVGTHLTINHSVEDEVDTDGTGAVARWAQLFSPIQPVRNEDGTYVIRQRRGAVSIANPVAEAKEVSHKITTSRALGNVFGEYTIMEGLTARISLGADVAYAKNRYYAPSFVDSGINNNGVARIRSGLDLTLLSENTLNYSTTFGDRHALDVLVGYTAQFSKRENVRAASTHFVTDKLGFHSLGAGSVARFPSSGSSSWGLVSYLGRVNYVLDDTYLFTATARVDGSSRFGAGNRYGFFPSGAVAWRLSNEEFIQDLNLFSNLKLRVSYGITGNQPTARYGALAALRTTRYILGGDIGIGFAPRRVPNPDLKWETTRQFDVGLDMGFFQNRLSVTADYYRKITNDLLLRVTLPWTTGFSSALQNVGSMLNEGFELAVSGQISTGEFSWSTRFNISTNRNEVLDLGERGDFLAGASTGHLKVFATNIVKEGAPLNSFYGRVAAGVWQLDEAEKAAQYGAVPGERRYKDLNGDGIIDADDRTIIGTAQPQFIGGFSNNFSYKGFELSIFLQGSYGNEILNMNRFELFSLDGSRNNSTAVLNRWTPENPSDRIPRAYFVGGAGGSYILSDFQVEDGSYLRLQDITLAYSIPENVFQSVGIDRLRVYLSAQNLLTITNYSGYDPEVSSYGQANLALGHDYGAYPSVKTYTLGFSLGL